MTTEPQETPAQQHVGVGLPKEMVKAATQFNYFYLARPAFLQHKEDGSIRLDGGRMIQILPRDFRELEDEYSATELFIVVPGKTDVRKKLPQDVIQRHAPANRPLRVIVLPEGKEAEIVAESFKRQSEENPKVA